MPFMSNKLFGVISIYGLLIACAILLGTVLCQREARRLRLPEDTGLDMEIPETAPETKPEEPEI